VCSSDLTPISLHADDIEDSVVRAGGTQQFEEIFAGRARAEMIGLFLALLELMRRGRIRVCQEEPNSSILLRLIEEPAENAPRDTLFDEPEEESDTESGVEFEADVNDEAVGELSLSLPELVEPIAEDAIDSEPDVESENRLVLHSSDEDENNDDGAGDIENEGGASVTEGVVDIQPDGVASPVEESIVADESRSE